MIAYRDVHDGSIRLLDCRTRDCAQADQVTLTGADLDHATPTLTVDRAGRTLVAYQDLAYDRIMLATCAGTRCHQAAVAAIPRSAGENLGMTLDGQGRPVIAWSDLGDHHEWDLMLTTVLNPARWTPAISSR